MIAHNCHCFTGGFVARPLNDVPENNARFSLSRPSNSEIRAAIVDDDGTTRREEMII
jgi:hypothetical protein